MSRLMLMVAAVALPGLCQVQVEVRTSQSTYLAGEPVFVIADVKNVGTDPVGYGKIDSDVHLTVEGGRTKREPNLTGCFGGYSGGGFGGLSFHPPMLQPGQTIPFWYLLKGYDLRAGSYVLRASGKAGVRWKYYPPPPPKHAETDPIEGRMFDSSMKLVIRDATEAELRQRYASYVADAEGLYMELRSRAREAIAEMAPPFLEKKLLAFADQPEDVRLAIKGLGQLPTDESRSDLVVLFDKCVDVRLRPEIVEKLAGIGTAHEMAFFASLLPGRSSEWDDRYRTFAALGLGRIGGAEAVRRLKAGLQSPNPLVRHAIAIALANTRAASAIPILIEMYSDQEAFVGDTACSALVALTHYKWCDGGAPRPVEQARWRAWWRQHASSTRTYGPDSCPAFGASLPAVK